MKMKGLLLISFGILINITFFIFTWEAKAASDTEESFNLEKELLANAEADDPLITGWINIVEEDYLIIDDSQFAITKDTVFLVEKRQLGDGIFVSFRRDVDNNLLEINIAEPTEEDIARKPDERTGFVDVSESDNESATPKREDNLRYEDGEWVN